MSTHEIQNGEDEQLWIGWEWFEYHAKQRLEAVKFFITIYGAISALAAGFINTPHVFVTSILSVIALSLAVLFWQLDKRSMQLVEIGESIVSARWKELGFQVSLDPISQAKVHQDTGLRYKHVFLVLFCGAGVLSFLLFIASVYIIVNPISVITVPPIH